MTIFPITFETVLTLAGGCVIAAIAGLWLKRYLPDWRFTPLMVMVVVEVVLVLIQTVASALQPTGEEIVRVLLIGLQSSTLETFGYEVIVNALGLMGVGTRSEAEQLEKATRLLASHAMSTGRLSDGTTRE